MSFARYVIAWCFTLFAAITAPADWRGFTWCVLNFALTCVDALCTTKVQK